MYSIQLPAGINQMIEFLYRFGFWHRGDKATVRETASKLFYTIAIFCFPASLMAGAIETETSDEFIFLTLTAIITTVMSIKLLYLIWKKKEILNFLQRICIHSFKNEMEFTLVDEKLKRVIKIITSFYFSVIFAAITASIVVPFVGSEKKLFYNIGFPLNYKNNEIAFWIALIFSFFEIMLAVVSILFNIFIWYFFLNISLKYDALGIRLSILGENGVAKLAKRKISEKEKQDLFKRDLVAGVESHKNINEYCWYVKSDEVLTLIF